MRQPEESFVPALGRPWLTPLYDVVAQLVGEKRFKAHLVDVARIEPGHDVLDLGCGTGTLMLMVHQRCPTARVCGVDIDPEILAIARRKIAGAGAALEVFPGSATAPPFPPTSFDRILTTLMLHHLSTVQKQATLAASLQLLRPGGELHIADWGRPHNLFMKIAAMSVRFADGGENTAINLRGELPEMVRAAGFVEVRETEHWMSPFGTIAFVRAHRPE